MNTTVKFILTFMAFILLFNEKYYCMDAKEKRAIRRQYLQNKKNQQSGGVGPSQPFSIQHYQGHQPVPVQPFSIQNYPIQPVPIQHYQGHQPVPFQHYSSQPGPSQQTQGEEPLENLKNVFNKYLKSLNVSRNKVNKYYSTIDLNQNYNTNVFEELEKLREEYNESLTFVKGIIDSVKVINSKLGQKMAEKISDIENQQNLQHQCNPPQGNQNEPIIIDDDSD